MTSETLTQLRARLSNAEALGEQTVPSWLLGCWRRNWIQFDDGPRETAEVVIWLQTASGMGDIRLMPGQQSSESDSSCGITVVDTTTEPYATAQWLDGEHGFAQQAVTKYPEDGWLDSVDDHLMYERAPSGAYVEQWERLDESTVVVAHAIAAGPHRRNLYLAGEHAVMAVESPSGCGAHEFSYGVFEAASDTYVVRHATDPTHVGQPLTSSELWQVISLRSPANPAIQNNSKRQH